MRLLKDLNFYFIIDLLSAPYLGICFEALILGIYPPLPTHLQFH
jgi:hypothetical protein